MSDAIDTVMVEFEQGNLLVATCERVVVVYLGEVITVEFLDAAKRIGQELSKRWGKIAALTIMPPDVPVPSAA